ncbi:MAG TPA: hypothetical protein VFI24_17660 [Pyrinomonadaceae bacterium]|nr:hypothetical protein [Pyrinomonadaceae bacterium]
MRQTSSRLLLIAVLAFFSLAQRAVAQSPSAALASLPEADALVYISPQRILNEAAPRVMSASEVTKMRAGFADIKQAAGIDPASVEYLVIAVRFNKPASNLSFVAPDVMIVAGGDFSSDSLLTLGQVYLQDKVRTEKYGSKSMTVMKIDPLATEAEKNPILKPFVEIGAVPLTANSIAIGTLPYLRSAIDAADGNGRISAATLESLFRDPNVLMAASGAPLASFAKSFGLRGLENTSRESRCDTPFGNFYAAVTMTANNFSLRGAMNADNPDTAKIINNLISGLMQQGISAVPDKNAQTILQALKMSARDNEVVWEADIPEKIVADYLKPSPTKVEIATPPTKPPVKRPIRKKRTKP